MFHLDESQRIGARGEGGIIRSPRTWVWCLIRSPGSVHKVVSVWGHLISSEFYWNGNWLYPKILGHTVRSSKAELTVANLTAVLRFYWHYYNSNQVYFSDYEVSTKLCPHLYYLSKSFKNGCTITTQDPEGVKRPKKAQMKADVYVSNMGRGICFGFG